MLLHATLCMALGAATVAADPMIPVCALNNFIFGGARGTVSSCNISPPPPSPPAFPTCAPSDPPPPPLLPPLPSSASPDVTHSCDIAVVGHGLAGCTAAMTAARLRPDLTVCSIGTGPAESTSARSGRPWLLLPDVTEDEVVPLLDALAELTTANSLPFERARAEHFIRTTAEAVSFVESAVGATLEPVPAYADEHVTTCSDADVCCRDGLRLVDGHGALSCDEVEEWLADSGCTDHDATPLQPLADTWPTYYGGMYDELLEGKIRFWVDGDGTTGAPPSVCMQQHMLVLEVMLRMLAQPNIVRVDGMVTHASYATDSGGGAAWTLLGDGFHVQSRAAVWASGGFGAVADAQELYELGMESTAASHALNSGILWQTAKREGWAVDPVNAWFLEHVPDYTATPPGSRLTAQWFLWGDKSTVLARPREDTTGADWRLVYDEAQPYDSRGRARRAARGLTGTSDLYYISHDPHYGAGTVTELLGPAAQAAIDGGAVPKSCGSRSPRLWRNYIATCYNYGEPVGRDACEGRVGAADPVTVLPISQGVIDTISGPVVDKDQRFHAAGWAAGNAASPGLARMYIGPGSTLGNALQTGYLAAKDAVSRL